jgi:hypothetical protein
MRLEAMKLTGVMKKINRAMNQLPNAAATKRGLVFISYSSADEATVVRLDTAIAEAGLTPWWARHLQGGERFGKVIIEAIDAACAAVVVWSAASVQSAWVLAEATRAFEQGKLVPVRFGDLHPMDIPPPFTTLHTLLLEDRAGLIQAIERQIEARSRGAGSVPAAVALNNSAALPAQG